jgi:hypothetical protein
MMRRYGIALAALGVMLTAAHAASAMRPAPPGAPNGAPS